MKNNIKITGRAKLQVFDKEGNLLSDSGWRKNIITNAGKAAVAGLVGNTGSITAFSYLALGTSAAAVAATDTTLTAEITDTGLARVVATVSRTTTTVTNDTLRLTYTWTATGAKTIEECGILNASSGGTLLAHILTGSNTVANTNPVVVTYDIRFA